MRLRLYTRYVRPSGYRRVVGSSSRTCDRRAAMEIEDDWYPAALIFHGRAQPVRAWHDQHAGKATDIGMAQTSDGSIPVITRTG